VGRGHLKKHQDTKACANGRKEYSPTVEAMEEEISNFEMPNPFDPPEEYCIDMDGENPTKCPVENCPYAVNTRSKMRRHFRNVHNKDVIVIRDEGLLPRCTECGLFQFQNINKERIVKTGPRFIEDGKRTRKTKRK
jgi:hypothetical protein